MSVINRLIARATGSVELGIRANLPARFDHGDQGNNNDFLELSEKIREPQSVAGRSTPAIEIEPNKPGTAAESHRPNNSEIEKTPAVSEDNSDEQSTISWPKPLVESNVHLSSHPENPTIDSKRQSQTKPTINTVSLNETAEPVATTQQVPASIPNSINVDQRKTVTQLPKSPAPLLSRVETPTYSATQALPVAIAQKALNSTDKQNTVPDISIHIGRIDLRTSAVKPATTRTASVKPSAIPSLADYLNGGSS